MQKNAKEYNPEQKYANQKHFNCKKNYNVNC